MWGKNVNHYKLFPPGLEPGAFRVLGERDNHYTTETTWKHVTTVDLIYSYLLQANDCTRARTFKK